MIKIGSTPGWLHTAFYRRPFFWWGLAVLCAIHLAYAQPVPLWAWLALTGGGVLLLFRFPEVGITVLLAGLAASITVTEKAPPSLPHLRDGAAVTLQGHVVGPAGEGRFLLQAERRLTLTGWTADTVRFGVRTEEAVRPGEQVEVSGRLELPLPPGNPGDFDARLDWLKRGVHYVVATRPEGFRRLEAGSQPPWQVLAARLRAGIFQRNRETLSPTGSLIASGFLLGEDEGADPELSRSVAETFRDSGTIHLLVVSGTQVTLVLGLFIWLGWRLWSLRFLFWGLGLLALAGFWLLTDGSASVSRASLMGGVFILGLCLQREPDGENCLGIAGLALLAGNRFTAFDIGAQLSFAAVWGLIRLSPALYRAFTPVSDERASNRQLFFRGLAAIAAASLAAHLATAPLLALHFQRTSWSGILANVPMSALTLLFTYLALVHTLLAQVGVTMLGGVVDYFAASFTGWSGFFSAPPLGARDVFPFPPLLVPLYLAALALPSLRKADRRLAVGTAAVLVGALFLSERLPALPPSAPLMRALDIGQGDAILLQGTDGVRVLVDAGPPPTGKGTPRLVRALRGLRIPDLDALVITHADNDHTGGVPALLEHVPVRRLIHRVEPEPEEADLWQGILDQAAALRIPIVSPEPGDQLPVGASLLTFLGPLSATHGNEASLVCRWDAGGSRFLLTGDAGLPSEQELLRWGPELRAHVLKVGHHGSNGSTGADWLEAVKPQLAVISCGRNNRFGHPATPVLERLRHAGVPVVRTDLGGMVTVRGGAARVTAATFR